MSDRYYGPAVSCVKKSVWSDCGAAHAVNERSGSPTVVAKLQCLTYTMSHTRLDRSLR